MEGLSCQHLSHQVHRALLPFSKVKNHIVFKYFTLIISPNLNSFFFFYFTTWKIFFCHILKMENSFISIFPYIWTLWKLINFILNEKSLSLMFLCHNVTKILLDFFKYTFCYWIEEIQKRFNFSLNLQLITHTCSQHEKEEQNNWNNFSTVTVLLLRIYNFLSISIWISTLNKWALGVTLL